VSERLRFYAIIRWISGKPAVTVLVGSASPNGVLLCTEGKP